MPIISVYALVVYLTIGTDKTNAIASACFTGFGYTVNVKSVAANPVFINDAAAPVFIVPVSANRAAAPGWNNN